ncbi:hypothetical protein BSKO_03266 [Bryopsis sp. KO-2023]|nr:hypothetical protein BSKO_03266 [Bryopsis sp. KO-2023]
MQSAYLPLSLLGICAVVGAGVGVGSGVAFMAQGMMEEEAAKQQQQKAKMVASPFERSAISKGFAAAGLSK